MNQLEKLLSETERLRSITYEYGFNKSHKELTGSTFIQVVESESVKKHFIETFQAGAHGLGLETWKYPPIFETASNHRTAKSMERCKQ